MERVLAAVDAGLAALSIMTAPDMPKEVFLEDVIERVVMMTKQQLQNTIFPEFDPVYKVNPKNKGTCDIILFESLKLTHHCIMFV